MVEGIPKVLLDNKITPILDEVRFNYGILVRKGYIYGLIAVDQDAKIVAIDGLFDKKLNYWDLSSIGAALYGIARQGKDFFNADNLEVAMMAYNNMKLFVKSVGDVQLQVNKRRDMLIVVLADKDVNLGIMLMQLGKCAPKIRAEIERSKNIRNVLTMNENEG